MIIYLYGDNSFGISRQARLLKQKYLDSTGPEGDLESIDVAEKGINTLLGGLSVMPMFVSSRLILASNLAKAKPTSEQIDEIISSTAESTNLVIIDPKPDKRTVMYKKLSKLKGAKEFKNLTGGELIRWVTSEAKRRGAEITTADAKYLADMVGEDQWTLNNEIDKLTSYNHKITKTTIDELAVPSLENNTFVLTEALASKDLSRVLKLYKDIKLQGHADQLILGAITYQYRTIMLALLKDSELNRAYKMSPYSLSKSQPLASKYDLDDIKKAYKIIADSDMATKSGELSSAEAMNRLFYRLCSI
jgi:DNA polymerase-3 subunit delta